LDRVSAARPPVAAAGFVTLRWGIGFLERVERARRDVPVGAAAAEIPRADLASLAGFSPSASGRRDAGAPSTATDTAGANVNRSRQASDHVDELVGTQVGEVLDLLPDPEGLALETAGRDAVAQLLRRRLDADDEVEAVARRGHDRRPQHRDRLAGLSGPLAQELAADELPVPGRDGRSRLARLERGVLRRDEDRGVRRAPERFERHPRPPRNLEGLRERRLGTVKRRLAPGRRGRTGGAGRSASGTRGKAFSGSRFRRLDHLIREER